MTPLLGPWGRYGSKGGDSGGGPSGPLSAEALAFARRACALAGPHGLGVFFHVHRRHLARSMPALAVALRAAGAAGLKFGGLGSALPSDAAAAVGWAHACREEGLLVNAHDDLLPAGLHLLLPNLLSFEAARASEAFSPPLNTVRLALIRGLAGPADFGPVLHHPRRRLSPVHVLVLPVLLYSPLQHLFLYSSSAQVATAPAYFRRVWGELPTTWARTVWLGSHPDSHAVVARRAPEGGVWYVGAVCVAAGAAGGCLVDVRTALHSAVGCGRPMLVEAYVDAGDPMAAGSGGSSGGAGSVSVPAPARVDSVCDAQLRLPLDRVELGPGQALLVVARPYVGDEGMFGGG